MQDTAGIFLISCNRIRLFPDMMDVSMLIQNAKEGCGAAGGGPGDLLPVL